MRNPSGQWHGYAWQRHQATASDASAWDAAGANIGLLAGSYPAVDIDCLEADLANEIERIAKEALGPAPVRVGLPPKRLLMYRTSAPFGRLQLILKSKQDGTQHLVEILGAGQQYLVHGIHPKTGQPYSWNYCPVSWGRDKLSEIDRDAASAFLAEVAHRLADRYETQLSATRTPSEHPEVDQGGLLAPSIEAVRAAVALIPNTDDEFPGRGEYIQMGYAIRAAAGEAHDADGLEIYLDWASRWEDHPDGNLPGQVERDWSSLRPPYRIGWGWIADKSRAFGFNSAIYEFDALPSTDDGAPQEYGTKFSDQWLANEVIARRGHLFRYVPAQKRWYCWNGSQWTQDTIGHVDATISAVLREVALKIARRAGAEPKLLARAERICSYSTALGLRGLIMSDPRIALPPDAFDSRLFALNTPSGIVNLETGMLEPASPEALCSKQTSVGPAETVDCPTWLRFIHEATQGDQEVIAYLQRLAGYCLTGETIEQQFTFVWGPGGTGKTVFLNTLLDLLGDYARPAPMSTFMASRFENHPTELAGLQGARLVTASETSDGGRWNEQRLKLMTGAEPIAARFLYGDFFTYTPQFKLVLVGNHKPSLRTVDAAIRRRIQLVPFTVQPSAPDARLAEKLRAEAPGILRWAIEGCLAWRKGGLVPPTAVTAATNDYFEDQDALGRWMREECEVDPDGTGLTQELFQRWQEWAGRSGEHAHSERWLASTLADRGLARWKHPVTRRNGFRGIRLVPASEFPALPEADFAAQQASS